MSQDILPFKKRSYRDLDKNDGGRIDFREEKTFEGGTLSIVSSGPGATSGPISVIIVVRSLSLAGMCTL